MWEITASLLNRLWIELFPRIISYVWYLEIKNGVNGDYTEAYRVAFLNYEGFRKAQFMALAEGLHPFTAEDLVNLTNVPISVDVDNPLDLRIGSNGLVFPWPQRPTQYHIYNMYQSRKIIQMGWSVPGVIQRTHLTCEPPSLDNFFGYENFKNGNVADAIADVQAERTGPDVPPAPFNPGAWVWYIEGNHYLQIMERLPKMIAYVWDNDRFRRLYRHLDANEDPRPTIGGQIRLPRTTRQALTEFDIKIPSAAHVEVEERSECIIRIDPNAVPPFSGIILPDAHVGSNRPDRAELFAAMASGAAGVPTFTYSVG